MSETKAYEAGKYQLKSFKLKDVQGNLRDIDISLGRISEEEEIKLVVYEWVLNESVFSGNVYGSAHILDGVGLFYDFPLRGEEILYVEYQDFFGEVREEEFFVYSITDLKPINEGVSSGLSYTIHFTSIGKFVSETRMIRKSYSGLISQSVGLVFENYFQNGPNGFKGTTKEIEIEPTIGEQSLVVPYYSPEDTMHFFSRRAYGGVNLTSTYHFFETREKYMFATYDYLVQKYADANLLKLNKIPVFHWNIYADDTPAGQLAKMESVIDFKIMKPFDTMEDMISGAYNKQVLEVDTILKTSHKTDYNYQTSFPAYNSRLAYTPEQILQPINSKSFVDKFMTEGRRYMVIKDYPAASEQNYPAVRPKTYYPELIGPSWAVSHHHKKNTLAVVVYGRNNLFPGMLVDVVVDQFRFKQGKEDKKYSGRYIIESIVNSFVGDSYKQILTLHRGGVGTEL